jgi:hypothetical protein
MDERPKLSARSHQTCVTLLNMGKPRLPWKRGPAAWEIASSSDEIKVRLYAQRRNYLSLRKTAKIFGISTQPIRDWVRFGYLKREGPRKQFALGELERFIGVLAQRAKPFPNENYTERFIQKTGKYPYPFQTLGRAQFIWPKGRKALTPYELAELIGCHPALIIKAIHDKPWLARRKSPCRWEITRYRWQNTFFFSSIAKPRLPGLPRQPLFSTMEAAEHLGRWGVSNISAQRIREMIRSGELEGIPPPVGKRKWFITRKSLERIRKNHLTA